MTGEVLAAGFAFAGAAVGAALTYAATRRDTLARVTESRQDLSQREGQGRREEWGRRFTAALDDVASEDFRRRELGRVVLVALSTSSLATPEDRDLADAVLSAGARIDAEGDRTIIVPAGISVDDVVVVEDDGDDEEGSSR